MLAKDANDGEYREVECSQKVRMMMKSEGSNVSKRRE